MRTIPYVYLPAAGETWDSIAMTLYGRWEYAREMLCVNPQYTDRIVMRGTERLKLPDISETLEQESAAPWKKEA